MARSEVSVYVDAEWLSVRVDLPEAIIDDGEGEITEKAKERAKEAIVAALPQRIEVYLDGQEEDPAIVNFDPWALDADDTEFRVE